MDRLFVYYAENKACIRAYPTGSQIIKIKEGLAGYKTSKGAIQFPLEKGIPVNPEKENSHLQVSARQRKCKRQKIIASLMPK